MKRPLGYCKHEFPIFGGHYVTPRVSGISPESMTQINGRVTFMSNVKSIDNAQRKLRNSWCRRYDETPSDFKCTDLVKCEEHAAS